MASRRTLTIGVAVVGVVAALLAAAYWAIYAGPPQSTERLAEAPANKKTIFEYAPESNGAEDYRRVVDWVTGGPIHAGSAVEAAQAGA